MIFIFDLRVYLVQFLPQRINTFVETFFCTSFNNFRTKPREQNSSTIRTKKDGNTAMNYVGCFLKDFKEHLNNNNNNINRNNNSNNNNNKIMIK